MNKMGWIFKLILFIVGIVVSFTMYPFFSGVFTGGLVNIVSNLTHLVILLVILVVLLALPYIKMAGFGLLLGLLLNYLMQTGAW